MEFDLNIFDSIEDGIFILDAEKNVKVWNLWLEVNTKIKSSEIIGKKLQDFFPEVESKNINRKIKTAFSLKTPVFMSCNIDHYLIKIPLNKMRKSSFTYMQQNVEISLFKENLLMFVIYDQTPLLEAQEQILIQATTDQLTGAYNRIKFSEVIKHEISKTKRYRGDLSLIIFDIDHFKKVNDNYGHLAGDYVLKTLSSVVKSLIRTSDFFARWGGEEFILLISETDIDGAYTLAEKIRTSIEEYKFNDINRVTVSLGVSQYSMGDSEDDLIKLADDALYKAKEGGRNRTELCSGKNRVTIGTDV